MLTRAKIWLHRAGTLSHFIHGYAPGETKAYKAIAFSLQCLTDNKINASNKRNTYLVFFPKTLVMETCFFGQPCMLLSEEKKMTRVNSEES